MKELIWAYIGLLLGIVVQPLLARLFGIIGYVCRALPYYFPYEGVVRKKGETFETNQERNWRKKTGQK